MPENRTVRMVIRLRPSEHEALARAAAAAGEWETTWVREQALKAAAAAAKREPVEAAS